MKKVTKIVAVIAALVMSLCLCLLTACGGNYSETYTGTLSQQSYTSEENAAKAFVEAEIASSNMSVTFTKVEVEEEALSEEEVEKLELGDVENVEYVKKATVYYSEGGAQPLAIALDESSASTDISQLLYIVKYVDGGYKYYSPALTEGENLTKSYYDDVFSSARYENVTVTGSMYTTVRATISYSNGQTQSQSESSNVSYTYKITKNAVVATMTQSASGKTATMYNYLVKTTTGYVIVMEYNGSYEVSGPGQLNSTADFLWSGLIENADHTYFQKTKSGFTMKTEQAKQMAADLLEDAGVDSDMLDMFDELEYNFYVSEGNIIKMEDKVSASISYSEGGNSLQMAIAASSKYDFGSFGTTTVTLPDDVVSQLTSRGYTIVTE